ncbi:MAG: DUF262 domain-containing protein [Crenarchaeota archaeon]|nr:DUF262 domain-containing protein [Thermoproteota archaeon]
MTVLEKLVKELATLLTVDLKDYKVWTNTASYTVQALLDNLQNDVIRISPELQRSYVWDDVTASRFIESVIYGLPIPPIILASYEGALYVLDGVQRLTTLRRFYNDELRLVGVSQEEIAGKRFKTLPSSLKKRFVTATIPVIIVSVNAPREVAGQIYLEIFRRLNLGAKRMTFTQVLFCSIPTAAIAVVKQVANSEVFRRVFEPSEQELRDMRHYYISLCLHLAFNYGEPLNMIGSFKQRYIRNLINFIFNPDTEQIEKVKTRVEATLDLADRLGFRKEMFSPSTYVEASRARKKIANPVLAQVIMLALYEVAEKKEKNGRLVLELKVENPEELKRTLIETLKTVKIDGKDFRTLWTEIVKSGRVENLRKLYEKVRDILKLAVS